MTGAVGIIGAINGELEALARKAGLRATTFQTDQLTTSTKAPVETPDAVLVDVRRDRSLLGVVAAIKRRYPALGVAIAVTALEPELMLEGMRAGVNEVLAEPFTQDAFEAAIGRIVVQRVAPVVGRVFAVVGAKGGVGATTIAVNLAEAFAKAQGGAMLIDLHLGSGDAAVFLGVDPRFTIVEALENTHRLDEAFLKGLLVRTRSGLDLLAASSKTTPAPIDPHRVKALIDFAANISNCIVLDVPRLDMKLIESLDMAASIFVVVNQELPTIRNAHPLVKRLRQLYGDRVSILVNRSDRLSEISLEDVSKAVGMPIRHVFPNDYRQAVSAANKGQPLAGSTQGRLAESFHAFVKTLTGQIATEAAAADESSRLFGWLSPRKSY